MHAHADWGESSGAFDDLRAAVEGRSLADANEAQTRYTVIDGFVRSVFRWPDPMVSVEERESSDGRGYIDYVLRCGDYTIVVEAKRYGADFPSPTRRRRLKLAGSVLAVGDVGAAIGQARTYSRSQAALVAVVTNGGVWCCFNPSEEPTTAYGRLFFPFDHPEDAEDLFRLLSQPAVQAGSLREFTGEPEPLQNRLLAIVRDADDRVGRNTVADYIAPALDQAIYSGTILSDAEQLTLNYVDTDSRARYDSQLGVHLADPRPTSVVPAHRIRRAKKMGELHDIVRLAEPSRVPPVTLIVGGVGAGKSTYLRHFQLVSATQILAEKHAHWVYVDFEKMGPGDAPRRFLYATLRDYLIGDHPTSPTDWKRTVEPAYDGEISGLARGPLALLFTTDKPAFNHRVADHIQADFDTVEPYVDKVFSYLARQTTCVVVLDNIDLYEDDSLEAEVLSEGLAFSKRVACNVVICIRDRTYIAHKNDPSLDAYELRLLWIDPPPFKEVLARRLTSAKQVLKGRSARLALPNDMVLAVPDLSIFFDVVQRSVLAGRAGDMIDCLADQDIRRGLSMIASFLTSWHVQADRAVRQYLLGETDYTFPFQEVFKGAVLGHWLRFREGRTVCLNLFDARLGARRLEPLRWWALQYAVARASHEHSVEITVADVLDFLSALGASATQSLESLRALAQHSLIRDLDGSELSTSSTIAVTRTGAYYARTLASSMVYVEQVMMDTAIFDPDPWTTMSSLTEAIERERSIVERMKMRAQRIAHFTQYLADIESDHLTSAPSLANLTLLSTWRKTVLIETDRAVAGASRIYEQG